MNDKMEEWMKQREEKVQRFTHSEIQAEILRQRIQELESQCLEIHSQDSDDFHFKQNVEKLERLKDQLATLQQPASLASEGRAHMERVFEIARKGMQTGIVPPDSEDVLNNCQNWLDSMEAERRKRRVHELGLFRQGWRNADWDTRVGMMRWLGRWGTRHVVGQRVRYEVARVGMKAAIWISRR